MRDFVDMRKDKPIVLTPMQYNLDSSCHLNHVDGTLKLTISDPLDAELLINWLNQRHWKERLVSQLQSISENLAGEPLLSTWVPLVELRYNICSLSPNGDKDIQALLTQIFTETRPWRDPGVDTVDITGHLNIQ